MAVLVTAIHALAKKEDVDARDKPAHDAVIQQDRHVFSELVLRTSAGACREWPEGAFSA
jgi:hypothetical protein